MLFNFNLHRLTQSAGKTESETQENKTNLKTEQNSTKSSEEVIKEYTAQLKEKLEKMCDPTNGMNEKEQQKYDRKIRHKIERGEKLSPQEMEYIRIHYPDLYPNIVRVQIQRKSLETQLKHCRSKQQVNQVSDSAVLRVSDKDPARQALIAAYENVTQEFKKSPAYQHLPDTDEEAKELAKKGKTKNDSKSMKSESNRKKDNDQMDETDLLGFLISDPDKLKDQKQTDATSKAAGQIEQYFSQEEFGAGQVFEA